MSALVTVSFAWSDGVAAVVATAAFLAALAYLYALARRGVRFVRRYLTRIKDLLEGELEHNHGSSMKDDVHGIAVSVGLLQRNFEDMQADVTRNTSLIHTIKGDLDTHLAVERSRQREEERNPHE